MQASKKNHFAAVDVLLRFIKHQLPRGNTLRYQASMVVLGDSITFVMLFASSMVLARLIAVEDMATYRQVNYLGPLVVGFTELGISASVYRFFHYYSGMDRQIFLGKALMAAVSMGAFASLILVVLAYPLAKSFSNPQLQSALLISSAYPLTILPWMLVRPTMIAKGFSLKATILETAFGIGTAFALIIPIYFGSTMVDALTFWIGAQALRLPVTWLALRADVAGFRPVWNARIAGEVWSYLWPIQLSRFPGLAMINFDKVVTSAILSNQAFAAYSLGAREIPFLNQIPFSISSVLVPRMVESFRTGCLVQVCEMWRKAALTTALLTFPFAAFVVWYAKPIVRVFFTSAYDESSVPFAAYAAITFLRVLDYGSMAKALGNSKMILRGAAFSAVVSLPLVGGMTWLWGIRGISCSLLLSTVLTIVFYLVSYRKILNCPIHKFFPFACLVGVAATSFMAVILSDSILGAFFDVHAVANALVLSFRLVILFALASVIYFVSLRGLQMIRPSFFIGIHLPGFKRG